MESTEVVTTKQWLRNFGYYTTWFVVWGALFSFLQPVTPEQMAGTTFWAVKIQQAVLGAGFGVICAIVFSILQNSINGQRRKWLSWVLAIGTWISINLLLAVAMGRFQ
jgi:hypothetical protein